MSIYPKVVPEDLENEIASERYEVIGNTTLCLIKLKNGLTVDGINHGSVDPRNFNAELGREFSRKGAIQKLWPILGARLADKLALINKSGAPSGKIVEMGSPVTYVGTKVIHAVPMTRLEYNIYRGWELPKNENGDDNGYLVEYADGGAPNVAGHTGYVSWSPQGVFEKAYDVGVRQDPETFLTRLKKEVDELKDRHDKLDTFIKGPNFDKIPEIEQEDLTVQRGAMK